MNKIFITTALIMFLIGQAQAEPGKPLLDKNKFSIGAGGARNTVDTFFGDITESGVQFFAAYDLSRVNLMEGVKTSIEVGYLDYGFPRPAEGGLWATGVINGAIQNNFGWLARLGLDFGDDSGLMFGAGLSFGITKRLDLRGEYVIRDEIDSLQLNLIYEL